MAEPLLRIGSRPPALPLLPTAERARLERRVKQFAWGGNAWHLVEFAVAVAAGVVADSVALVGFGIDSLIDFYDTPTPTNSASSLMMTYQVARQAL